MDKGDKEKGFDFEEMVAQVKRSTEGREDTPDSDCEKYFSDAWTIIVYDIILSLFLSIAICMMQYFHSIS